MQPQNIIKEKVHQTVYKLNGRPSTWRVVVDELSNIIEIEHSQMKDFVLRITKEQAGELAYLLTEATKEPKQSFDDVLKNFRWDRGAQNE